ncbi:hypothetical protein CALCODRAFT_487662 [Calocera cornea HHB12733]|uniref:Uncharacterized protein n=1 Tax=Calocera cornea HHB12733 TaxID=1353952 RepID=A0A165D007_9BASI|nr:hypothetical protein CALCODRAFT_488283 [Calocera cornea HHB12733]KZT51779.1 hypothetical protein CALCODRAFT_487662 [Calocera cornea HHB12733]
MPDPSAQPTPKLTGPAPAGQSLTPGTCQRILHNKLDRTALPNVQLINWEENVTASGRARDPPLFTIYISDGKFCLACVAGRDVVWQLETYRLRERDEVKVVGYNVWTDPRKKGCYSILIHNLYHVKAHPNRIGRLTYPPNVDFTRSIAYVRLRSLTPTYEWLHVDDQLRLFIAPRVLQGGEANIPVAPREVAPVGGWTFAVGQRLPAYAEDFVIPAHTPLDPNGRVQRGLEHVLWMPGHGWRWGASFAEIQAAQGAHPYNPTTELHFIPNPPAVLRPAQTPPPAPVYRGPLVYPPDAVRPDHNNPAHPGFHVVANIILGHNVDVWVRVTRIESKGSTTDLVVHDASGAIDIVVRASLKPHLTRMRLGRCYQIYNAACVQTRVYCRTFHPVQLSINDTSAVFEIDNPTVPEWVLNPWRLNSLIRGVSNKPIDVWCVVMNTSAIIPGKAKGDATKGWDTPPNLTRCEAWVTDKTFSAVRLMAWDEFPEQLYGRDGEVVLLHNVVMEDGRRDEICLKTLHGLTEILRGQDAPSLADDYNDMVAW